MPHPKHILVVSCLVQNSTGSVLLVKHKIRGWELPQGRVEEGEALIEALHREVLEETGVTIASPKLATIWSKLTEPSAVIHAFVADHADGEPLPSEETPEVAWFPLAEARDLIVHPVNRDRFLDLLSYQGELRFCSYSTGPYQVIDQ